MKNIVNKKISILGAEKSGIAAAKLAKSLGALPFVSDFGNPEKFRENIEILKIEGIPFETGGHSQEVFNCDFIVTSPGVPSSAPVIKNAIEAGIKVFSEPEFASWFCKGEIISISGTNGKSTVTMLLEHTLNQCGKRTYAGGNIGIAFSGLIESIREGEFVSLETSSFQLDHIDSFQPRISMILNITPDHLDRYDNRIENYIASKSRIFENQDGNDYYIFNADDELTPKTTGDRGTNEFGFSLKQPLKNGAYYQDGAFYFSKAGTKEFICRRSDLRLPGDHNAANALAVMIAAKILQCDDKDIVQAFLSFNGVEHRLEPVREINGIRFVNDSKATNVDSVWYALNSFNEPILLILGGKDKGNDYSRIAGLVKDRVRKIYAIGSSAEKVYGFFKEIVPVEKVSSMEEAVKKGFTDANSGEIVLLSPACASFDMFSNFEHRGQVFKYIVGTL